MLIQVTPWFWGMLILFIATGFFYIISFALIYYWHEKKTTLVILPALLTFEFFITAFFIISLGAILLQYLPDILVIITKT